MSQKNVVMVNLASRFATVMLAPLFNSGGHMTTKRFEGYRTLTAIFEDPILCEIIAQKLGKASTTEILFEELLLIRDIIHIPLEEHAPRIKSLNGIEYLAHLKIFRVHHSDFEHIVADLSHLHNLIEFDLTDGLLLEIPESLFAITALERIRIRKQKIKHLPMDVKNVSNLRVLDLSENNLMQLPIEIGLLDAVHSLHIQHNPIQHLPTEIGYMDALASLDISYTEVTELPVTLLKAQKLRVINLQSTGISSLTDDYFLQMHHSIKILGDQFTITAHQLNILETLAKENAKEGHFKQVLKQSITIAGVITTCVVIVMVSSFNHRARRKRQNKN